MRHVKCAGLNDTSIGDDRMSFMCDIRNSLRGLSQKIKKNKIKESEA